MRTTITLTPEAQQLVEQAMRERGASFKDVVNEALVQALRPPVVEEPFVQRTFNLGWSLTKDQMRELDERDELEKYLRLQRQWTDEHAADRH
ncbi:MAG TPA: hypothetical protein VNQ48_03685 [Microbacteriaceae bacterium]|nr:hypothetical protein [Microbacteriaceae bacterium]